MNKYNFLIALRSLWRDKSAAVINLIGLTLAFTAFILISQYVQFEKSYDQFHDNSEDIYRVVVHRQHENGEIHKSSMSYAPLKMELESGFPEVVSVARDEPDQGVVTTPENQSYRILYNWVDQELLSVFSIPLIYGNPNTCLISPWSAVLSETTAKMMYGNINPVGKTFTLSGSHIFTVTGVFEDIPENSHLKYKALFSWATIVKNGWWANNWNMLYVHTYLKLNTGNISDFQEKLNGLLAKNKPKNNHGKETDKMVLQKIIDIHLKSDLDDGENAKGGGGNVAILSLIAFALVILALLNTANLFAARATEQSGDVIKYTTIGARPIIVFMKFFLQLAFLSIISLTISFLIIYILYPFIVQHLSKVDFIVLSRPVFWLQIVAVLSAGLVFCSLYPFRIIILANRITNQKMSHGIRSKRHITQKTFMLIQFVVSVLLIAGFIVVRNQVHFMQHQRLGFNKEHKLILKGPNANNLFENAQLQRTFKNELSKNLNNREICISASVPGDQKMLTRYGVCMGRNYDKETQLELPINDVDESFFGVYGIDFLAGRNFKHDGLTNDKVIILSNKAALNLGFANPDGAIGKEVAYNNSIKKVIGVVDDIHHRSLKQEKLPLVYLFWKEVWRWIRIDYYTIPVTTENIQATINTTQKVWKQFFPLEPFEYFFLDDFFNEQYKEEVRFTRFFGFFSAFTIVIIGIGLLSMAMYMIKIRSKEVGVRKVNGAKTRQVIQILIKDYLLIFLIAFLIAVPVSVYLMNNWLANFAHKIELAIFYYIIAGGFIALVTFSTVVLGTWKTASQNPVKALRDE